MELLYSGPSKENLQKILVAWAKDAGFVIDLRNEHNEYEQAYDYLLFFDENFIYEIEQSPDEYWHLSRIEIGESVYAV